MYIINGCEIFVKIINILLKVIFKNTIIQHIVFL